MRQWVKTAAIVAVMTMVFSSGTARPLPAAGSRDRDGKDAGDTSQAYYHFLLAKGHEFENRYQEAIRELHKALEHTGDGSSIHLELARVYQRIGREGKALEHSRAAVEADPQNLDARLYLGRLYLNYYKESRRGSDEREEMLEEAIRQFEAVLEADPEMEDAYLDLAVIYRTQNEEDKALDLLERYLERSPFSERALFAVGNIHWSRQDWAQALENYLKILQVNPQSIRALLDTADTYRNMEEPANAVTYYLRALELNPDSVNILNQVASSYEETREFDLAARYYRKALDLKPDSLEFRESLGNVAFMQRDYLEASSQYLEVLDKEPDRLVTRFNLARVYENMGEPSLAEAQLKILLERLAESDREETEDEDLRQFQMLVLEQLSNILVDQGKYDEALRVLEQVDGAMGGKDLEARLNLARVYHMMDDQDAAMALLDDIAKVFPGEEDIDLLRSEMLLDAGRLEEGVPLLKKLEPRAIGEIASSDLWTRIVALYLAYERYDDAQSLLERITDTEEGKSPRGFFYLVNSLIEGDNLEEALKRVRDARGLFPNDTDFVFQEAEIRLRQDQDDACRGIVNDLLSPEDAGEGLFMQAAILYQRNDRFEMAGEVLQAGLERFPDSANILFQLGANFERQGDAAKSEKRFRQLLERDPDHAPALNYLGYMLADRGERLDEAMELIGRALSIDPRNGAYLDSMGWALFRAGMYEKAGSYLLDAVAAMPDDPTIHEHVGDYYRAVGKDGEAESHWREALSLGPDDPAAIEDKLRKLKEHPPTEGQGPEGGAAASPPGNDHPAVGDDAPAADKPASDGPTGGDEAPAPTNDGAGEPDGAAR